MKWKKGNSTGKFHTVSVHGGSNPQRRLLVLAHSTGLMWIFIALKAAHLALLPPTLVQSVS